MNPLILPPFFIKIIKQSLCMPGYEETERVTENTGVVCEEEKLCRWQELRKQCFGPECTWNQVLRARSLSPSELSPCTNTIHDHFYAGTAGIGYGSQT